MARVLFKVSGVHSIRVPLATRGETSKTVRNFVAYVARPAVTLPRDVMIASATFFGASL